MPHPLAHPEHPIVKRLKFLEMEQEELAAAMGVTVRAVRYWVTGERRLGGQMLRRMSEVLGVEPEQLLAVPESTP